MSTTAQSTPTEIHTSTSPRRQPGNGHSDGIPRSLSAASRNGVASLPRTNSGTQSQSRQPSATRPSDLASVGRRDFEQSNLAQAAPRRSGSRDARETYDRETTGSPKVGRGTSSRSGHTRYNSESSTPVTTATNGVPPGRIPSGSNAVGRRRTTVTAQTGEWTLGKTIGQGSMGKVKLATNRVTGEQVAIKIVPRLSQDEHRSQQDRERADHSKEVRTAREAAIVTLVDHPYICGMRDVVRTSHHWYMLFEYVNGGQMLDYIISHGRLKEKQARKFGRQIASALDYCHRNSIVHRDLKIENILISKENNIKIIDFGLSNLFSPRSVLKTFCGSLYFAAPELLQAKAYTGPEVDIWSFGIVLYVLVCGKVPFDDQSMPQLHAKIKKGVVEYPPWLSLECKHVISRMLVTEPRYRATLQEIMTLPWMTKGFSGPPDNCLPHREPLQLPLDPQVIEKMQGFDFGSSEYITKQLEGVLKSEEYQKAASSASHRPQGNSEADRKKSGMFDFNLRRKSAASKDTLTQPSAEAINIGEDPVNAFSPLISVYYLAREKQEREKSEANPGGLTIPHSPGEKPLQMPGLPAPEAAHTNSAAFELSGEAPTGGRSRPRARTQGEDEVIEKIGRVKLQDPVTPARQALPETPVKKESTVEGLLRRFSTRRGRDPNREKSSPQPPPIVAVTEAEASPAPPDTKVTLRKTRERITPPSAYEKYANKPELLAPPSPSEGSGRKFMGLARSTSVNSAELRRRWSRRGTSPAPTTTSVAPSEPETSRASLAEFKPAATDGSMDSESQDKPRVAASRAKSLGHARRESIQARRATREKAMETEVPEETDQELAEDAAVDAKGNESSQTMKPVYLKGLFSVSTTSGKPLSFIRADLIRVLKQLNIDYREVRGGFSCRHSPSIDTSKVGETKVTDSPPSESRPNVTPNRRRISFAGLRGSERDREREDQNEQPRPPRTPATPATPGSTARQPLLESSYTNSDDSDDDVSRRAPKSPRPPGETTTHVHSDLGSGMSMKFEILVVKVPLLSLHGLQFKKVEGNTWQFKHMAETILKELKL